jgi:hypothetical protein
MEVLVEAERKYTEKLAEAMIPVMIDAFFDMYALAKKESQGRRTLMYYQNLLVEVQTWNNMMMKQHTDAIIKSCAMFPNLLAAVFVLSVKIMSAVRISSESKKLNIKLPTNDIFVHTCYVAAATDLYNDPFIVVQDMKDSEKREILTQRFTRCIKKVISSLIPIQQILDTYIPNFTGGELDMVGADPAEVDDAPEDPPPPVTPEAAAASGEEPATPAAGPETPAMPEAGDPSGEVKEVPVSPAPMAPPPGTPAPVHQETLFDDAPEKK